MQVMFLSVVLSYFCVVKFSKFCIRVMFLFVGFSYFSVVMKFFVALHVSDVLIRCFSMFFSCWKIVLCVSN